MGRVRANTQVTGSHAVVLNEISLPPWEMDALWLQALNISKWLGPFWLFYFHYKIYHTFFFTCTLAHCCLEIKGVIKKERERNLWSFVIVWKIWQGLQLTDESPEDFSACSSPSALPNWVKENSLSRVLGRLPNAAIAGSEAKISAVLWDFFPPRCSHRLLKHSSPRLTALVRHGREGTGLEPGRHRLQLALAVASSEGLDQLLASSGPHLLHLCMCSPVSFSLWQFCQRERSKGTGSKDPCLRYT